MVLVREVFGHDPLSGHLFVFFSMRCDRVRIVYWDRNGFAMWTKRLERGRFRPTFSADGKLGPSAMEAAELALIVEGIELAVPAGVRGGNRMARRFLRRRPVNLVDRRPSDLSDDGAGPPITSPYAPDIAHVRAWLERMIKAVRFVEIVAAIVSLVTRMRDLNTELTRQLAQLRRKRPRSETLDRIERQLVLPLTIVTTNVAKTDSAPPLRGNPSTNGVWTRGRGMARMAAEISMPQPAGSHSQRRRWSIAEARAALSAMAASGLSPDAFAQREGLQVQRLRRWRPAGRRRKRGEGSDGGFRRSRSPRGDGAVEIVLRSGRTLRVSESIDAMALPPDCRRAGARRCVLSLPPERAVVRGESTGRRAQGGRQLNGPGREVFGHDPLSGHLFVFFSMRCDRVRIVYWDRNGFAMWTKRLERGRFRPTFSADGKLGPSAMEAAELALIVEGIELAGARRRPRWQPHGSSLSSTTA